MEEGSVTEKVKPGQVWRYATPDMPGYPSPRLDNVNVVLNVYEAVHQERSASTSGKSFSYATVLNMDSGETEKTWSLMHVDPIERSRHGWRRIL